MMSYHKIMIALFTTVANWKKLNVVQASTTEEMINLNICVRDSICIDEDIQNSTVECFNKNRLISSYDQWLLTIGTTNLEGCVDLKIQDFQLSTDWGVICRVSHNNSTFTKVTETRYTTTSDSNAPKEINFNVVEMDLKKSKQECPYHNDENVTIQLRVRSDTCASEPSPLPNANVQCYSYTNRFVSGLTDSEGFVSLEYDDKNDEVIEVYCTIDYNGYSYVTETKRVKSVKPDSNNDATVDFGSIVMTMCSGSENNTPGWVIFVIAFISIAIGILFCYINYYICDRDSTSDDNPNKGNGASVLNGVDGGGCDCCCCGFDF